MPHMLAQEHLAWVDALRYGTARNHTTIAAALSAIGSQPTGLILTFTGDGIWTIGANLVIPSTVSLMIPGGVIVSVSAGSTLTLNGQIIAWRGGWLTGAGSVVYGNPSPQPSTEIDFINARSIVIPTDAVCLVAGIPYTGSGTLTGRQVAIFTNQGAAAVGISFQTPPATGSGAQAIFNAGVDGNNRFYVAQSSAQPQLVINNVGLGITPGSATGSQLPITPAFDLHLARDSAAKPTTNTWTVSSDARIKEVLGVYEQGLAFLETLPLPKRYRYNGKANTPTDGKVSVNFIAQELQAVAPSWVSSYEAKLEERDPVPTDILTVNSNDLTFALLNAVKELAARVEVLEGATTRTTTAATAEAEPEPEEHEPPHPARRKRS